VDYDLLDEGVKVTDRAAFATCRAVSRRLGLMLGGSAGGSVHAALTRLEEFPAGSTVVTIVCDGGEKYLDTVFDDDWMAARELLDTETEREVHAMLARYAPASRGNHPVGAAVLNDAAAGNTHAVRVGRPGEHEHTEEPDTMVRAR
jgi:cystathionine beta-synthase